MKTEQTLQSFVFDKALYRLSWEKHIPVTEAIRYLLLAELILN